MEQDEYEALERIRADLQARHVEWYAEFDRARSDSRIRYEDLVARHEQLIEEFEQARREHGRRFDRIDTAIENDRQVTREMLLELRESSELARDNRHGIQSAIEGLHRVLDELRRNDGPSPAGA